MRKESRFAVLLLAAAMATSAADLAVTRVELFKHGVGFYERSGEIAEGEAVRLEFKASEMNDVLKSLTLVQDEGDGIAAVRYDSADPLDKRLEAFSFRVGAKASYEDLLSPKQRTLLGTIGKHPKAGWKSAIGVDFPAAWEAAEAVRAGLAEAK